MAALTLEDYRRGFAALLAELLAEFNVYLDRDGADPIADSVSTRQFTLWLSEEELAGMRDEMLPRSDRDSKTVRHRTAQSTSSLRSCSRSRSRPGVRNARALPDI